MGHQIHFCFINSLALVKKEGVLDALEGHLDFHAHCGCGIEDFPQFISLCYSMNPIVVRVHLKWSPSS